jgi:hypothetical protein
MTNVMRKLDGCPRILHPKALAVKDITAIFCSWLNNSLWIQLVFVFLRPMGPCQEGEPRPFFSRLLFFAQPTINATPL